MPPSLFFSLRWTMPTDQFFSQRYYPPFLNRFFCLLLRNRSPLTMAQPRSIYQRFYGTLDNTPIKISQVRKIKNKGQMKATFQMTKSLWLIVKQLEYVVATDNLKISKYIYAYKLVIKHSCCWYIILIYLITIEGNKIKCVGIDTDPLYLTAGYSPSVAHRVAICSAQRSRLVKRPDCLIGL